MIHALGNATRYMQNMCVYVGTDEVMLAADVFQLKLCCLSFSLDLRLSLLVWSVLSLWVFMWDVL